MGSNPTPSASMLFSNMRLPPVCSVPAWKSPAGILAAQSAATPDFMAWVADDIIGATGNLFDEYDVVRQIARAAIVSAADDEATVVKRRAPIAQEA